MRRGESQADEIAQRARDRKGLGNIQEMKHSGGWGGAHKPGVMVRGGAAGVAAASPAVPYGNGHDFSLCLKSCGSHHSI